MNIQVQTTNVHAPRASVPAASWGRLVDSCLRATVALALVTGLGYPLVTTWVAQLAFPQRAEGSLIERNGQIVGSALIGQNFTGAQYFQGRPSATSAPDPQNPEASVPAPYNAAQSGASNQGVTAKALQESVAERVAQYRSLNGLTTQDAVPVDAVTASASGLDPHISVANARLQVARVAAARGLGAEQVMQLVQQHTSPRDLVLLGEPRVNVLQLNLALDALGTSVKPAAQASQQE